MIREFTNKYVIRNKESLQYEFDDGNETESLWEATFFANYKAAKVFLKTYDEPEKFEIVRISIEIKEEEVM